MAVATSLTNFASLVRRNHIMDLCIECQANQASATNDECEHISLSSWRVELVDLKLTPLLLRRHGCVGSLQRELNRLQPPRPTRNVVDPSCHCLQHAFHFHCINRWLKTRQVCPLDNRYASLRPDTPVRQNDC